jgi:hypothetical protein
MPCSLDDALLFLNKWKEQHREVKLMLFCPDRLTGLAFGGLVIVEEVSRDEVKVSVGNSATMSFCLKNFEFEYTEPRGLGEVVSRVAGKTIDFSLSLLFPFGLFVTFIEPKDEARE